MSDYALTKLRESLAHHGLVEPIVWNRRTGHIVGGHQRLSQLDVLEGSADYRLGVACVDLPLKDEIELNVALNNPYAQGVYDYEKFFALFKLDDPPSLEGMGMSVADLELQFGEVPELGEMFAEQDQAQNEVLDDLKLLRNMKRDNRKVNPDMQAAYYLMVVFPTNEDREGALDRWKRPSLRFMAVDELLMMLKPEYQWRKVGEVGLANVSLTEQLRERTTDDGGGERRGEDDGVGASTDAGAVAGD